MGKCVRQHQRNDDWFLRVILMLAGVVTANTLAGDEPPAVKQSVPIAQRSLTPGAHDGATARECAVKLEQEHYLGRPIDDAVASRWFDTFLANLDPMKVYFLQSDVDAFAKRRDALDDLLKKGDVSFAYEVLALLLQRVDARQPLIERLLATSHDFTKDESIVVDRKATRWTRTEGEAEDLWRRRIKWDLLVQKMEKTPPGEVKDKILRRYRSFARQMHQMTADELLERYLSALMSSIDPHTSFMSPGTLENFEISMKLELDGIGAQLKVEDGYTTIVEITPGGAADKDGRLKAQDRVVGVGQGAEGEIVDTIDMNLNGVVKLIRGKRGTLVRLKVIPVGEAVPQVYDITRAKIELKDAEIRGEVIEHGRKPDGGPWRIGVINLPSFYMDAVGAQQGQANFKSCARDTKRVLDEFRRRVVDCVVLDLRANGGGSLPEVIKLTGLFIDRGPVVQIRDARKQIRAYDDVDAGMAWDGPLVLLTSKFSASASEILAGAIQDYRRGLIIGDESTHGKGTVQSLIDLRLRPVQRNDNPPVLGAIKITTQQMYLPSGVSTQLEGVKSDVILPSLTSQLPVGERDLDHALPFDDVPTAAFQQLGCTSEAIVEHLRRRSADRVRASTEFRKIAADVARYQKRKAEKTVSLVEAEFERQWNEGKAAEDEEEKKLEEMESQKRPVVRRDYYFDEAMDIAVDYLRIIALPDTPEARAIVGVLKQATQAWNKAAGKAKEYPALVPASVWDGCMEDLMAIRVATCPADFREAWEGYLLGCKEVCDAYKRSGSVVELATAFAKGAVTGGLSAIDELDKASEISKTHSDAVTRLRIVAKRHGVE